MAIGRFSTPDLLKQGILGAIVTAYIFELLCAKLIFFSFFLPFNAQMTNPQPSKETKKIKATAKKSHNKSLPIDNILPICIPKTLSECQIHPKEHHIKSDNHPTKHQCSTQKKKKFYAKFSAPVRTPQLKNLSENTKNKKTQAKLGSLCDSCRIQTCNLLIRSQMLYSVELRSRCLLGFLLEVSPSKAIAKVHTFLILTKFFFIFFRSIRILLYKSKI